MLLCSPARGCIDMNVAMESAKVVAAAWLREGGRRRRGCGSSWPCWLSAWRDQCGRRLCPARSGACWRPRGHRVGAGKPAASRRSWKSDSYRRRHRQAPRQIDAGMDEPTRRGRTKGARGDRRDGGADLPPHPLSVTTLQGLRRPASPRYLSEADPRNVDDGKGARTYN